jgi:signal peptidase I
VELAFWLAILAFILVGNVVALWRFGALAGLPNHSFGKSLLTVLLVCGVAAGISVGCGWLAGEGYLPLWTAGLIGLAAVVAGGLFLPQLTLGVPLRLSLRAGAILGLATLCLGLVSLVPIRLANPTYNVPTNAMAPTLCGPHLRGVCTHCGGATIVPFDELDRRERRPREEGICRECLRIGAAAEVATQPIPGDHFAVRRLATPERWDLVAFRFPPQQGPQLYIKRLVGLPGESIEIREGGIWINGQRLEPPPEIAGLEWKLMDDSFAKQEFAAPNNPYELGPDEYFFLGDFSTASYDSRFWGPVYESDLRGVASFIYYPPQSWRTFPAATTDR